MALTFALTGCSFVYTIRAAGNDGRVTFAVDPPMTGALPCVRRIEVRALGGQKAQPGSGDDAMRVDAGTFWFENRSLEDGCANTFPLTYGAALPGASEPGKLPVAAKPLLRNVVYEVSAATGSTGYGKGRFRIRGDGVVENLARDSAEGSRPAS